MEIIVRGRHITVPPRFRQHAAAKLAKLEKLDEKAVRIDVEVSKERNPRQSDRRERVELTIRSRGPAIRAEAAADDRYTALDLAFAKLESRLRRASDRRKVRHPTSETLAVARPEAAAAQALVAGPGRRPPRSTATGRPRPPHRRPDDQAEDAEPEATWYPSRWRATVRWWCGRRCTRPRR